MGKDKNHSLTFDNYKPNANSKTNLRKQLKESKERYRKSKREKKELLEIISHASSHFGKAWDIILTLQNKNINGSKPKENQIETSKEFEFSQESEVQILDLNKFNNQIDSNKNKSNISLEKTEVQVFDKETRNLMIESNINSNIEDHINNNISYEENYDEEYEYYYDH